MSFHPGDKIRFKRNLMRIPPCGSIEPILYVPADAVGTIIEIFTTAQGKGSDRTLHAKVKMDDGSIRTARLTSLERL